MRTFDELTTLGKARRLRPLALNALAQYGFDVDRLELIRNDLNGIFRVRTTGGQSYLLRVCLPHHHDLATLESEIIWLQALAYEAAIAAPLPIPARNGQMVVTADAAGVPEERRCMLFSWLPGRNLQHAPTTEGFERLGQLMARLHDHTEDWQPPAAFRVRTYNRLYPMGAPDGLLGSMQRKRFDAETRALIEAMEARITAELERLFRASRPQVLHTDLHWGNVKSYRDRLQPLDFEDLAWGFPVQDAAITFFYSLRGERFPELREAFQRGYATLRDWPEEYSGQVDLLMVHRALELHNYMLSTGFPGAERWFPAFVDNIHGRYRELLRLSD